MNVKHCLLAAAALLCTAAQAEGLSGSVTLASDRVERGVSQSSGQASLAGDLGWSHRLGAYVGLGLATVDSDQYGGAKLEWSPRLGWQAHFADSLWNLGFSGHLFPGALGQHSGQLPPRAAGAVNSQLQTTDFATAELNLSLGWKGLTLKADRSLTDYYGIGEESTQTGPLGQRITSKVAGSAGSWHVGLSYKHDFDDRLSAWAGVGRQIVRNFDALNYTDWSLGGSARGFGLNWSLEATGTNASTDYWQVRRSAGDTRDLASQRVTASVAWEF